MGTAARWAVSALFDWLWARGVLSRFSTDACRGFGPRSWLQQIADHISPAVADATSHAWGLEGHGRKALCQDDGGGRWKGNEDKESDRKRGLMQHKRELLKKYSRCSTAPQLLSLLPPLKAL